MNRPTILCLVAAGILGLALPSAADYLVHPFAMLGVDGGTHAFQLTPEGWVRSETVTLGITLDGASLEPWVWGESGPGVARTQAQEAGSDLELTAIAVRAQGLPVDLRFRGSAGNHDTVTCRVEQPVALLRIRVQPGAASSSSGSLPRVALRISADTGLRAAVTLRDGIVSRRLTPARPARLATAGGRTGIAVADSLVLLLSVAPDSVSPGLGPSGEPADDVLELIYRPQGEFALEVRMPFFPVAVDHGDETPVAALGAGDGAAMTAAAGRDWAQRLAAGAAIELPETGPAETAGASLYHILGGSLVSAGDRVVVLGAPFLYREFYMRDAAYTMVALDQFGYHAEARAGLETMLTHQAADGQLLSHVEQHDGIGLALWALGEHLALTRDRGFAVAVMDRVARAVDWYRNALAPYRADSPGERGEWDTEFPGILPATIMKDNEQVVAAHIVGHNLWASAGLAAAIDVAKLAGDADSVRSWQRLDAQFEEDLARYLVKLEKRTGGLITATFEGAGTQAGYDQPSSVRGGLDWGNLEIAYPTRTWRGDDPRLRTSLDAWSGRLQEGLYPYPLGFNTSLIHHYLPVALGHALLGAGSDTDREHLLTIFYDGLLGHATSTYGGAELINSYTRNVWPLENIPPHNTFSARYLLLLRDMLLREVGRVGAASDTLLIGGGLSPAWLESGATIKFEGAATHFGWVDLALEIKAASDAGRTLALRAALGATPPARFLEPRPHLPAPATPITIGGPPPAPAAIVFRAPLGFRITAVRARAGARAGTIEQGGRRVVLSPGAAQSGVEIELEGRADPRFTVDQARSRLGL